MCSDISTDDLVTRMQVALRSAPWLGVSLRSLLQSFHGVDRSNLQLTRVGNEDFRDGG